MNDFTKEELQTIDYLIDSYCQFSMPPQGIYAVLKDKIQAMIDNYEDREKELFSCYSGLTVYDEFFIEHSHMSAKYLMALFHELNHKCDGKIKEPGNYVFKLRLVKIK